MLEKVNTLSGLIKYPNPDSEQLILLDILGYTVNIMDKDLNILYCNWKDLDFIPIGRRLLGEKCYRVIRGRDTICEDCFVSKYHRYQSIIKFIKKSPVDGKYREFNILIIRDREDILGYIQLIKVCTEFIEYQKLNLKPISICSKCKKIRDNENWMYFENYFQKVGIMFSHGICSDCFKDLYPQYVDKIKR
ncbi:MAG: hypothetical protein N3C60_01400 [Calditerrivibrio sp.]|nr:hypothetical protein [Calditerrivibrio sp.]